jgi:alpha-tubulin suppressor-like RCC1 family protein
MVQESEYVLGNSCCIIQFHHSDNFIIRCSVVLDEKKYMIRCDWLRSPTAVSADDKVFLGLGICCVLKGSWLHVHRVDKDSCKFLIHDVVDGACGINHALICTLNGTVYALGSNLYGQCGIDLSVESVDTPVVVFENASKVSAGAASSFIIDRNGKLYVFGSNEYGQLSRSPDTSSKMNLTMLELIHQNIEMVSSGFGHTALLTGGEIYSCGLNSHDQLDFVTNERSIASFKPFKFPSKIQSVSCGIWNTAVVSCSELYICGRAPFYQEGPEPLPELLKTIESLKARQSNRFDHNWVRIEVPQPVVDVRLGSSLGVALSADNQTLYVFDTALYKVIEDVKLFFPPKSICCAGRWWSVSS